MSNNDLMKRIAAYNRKRNLRRLMKDVRVARRVNRLASRYDLPILPPDLEKAERKLTEFVLKGKVS